MLDVHEVDDFLGSLLAQLGSGGESLALLELHLVVQLLREVLWRQERVLLLDLRILNLYLVIRDVLAREHHHLLAHVSARVDTRISVLGVVSLPQGLVHAGRALHTALERFPQLVKECLQGLLAKGLRLVIELFLLHRLRYTCTAIVGQVSLVEGASPTEDVHLPTFDDLVGPLVLRRVDRLQRVVLGESAALVRHVRRVDWLLSLLIAHISKVDVRVQRVLAESFLGRNSFL